jgi:hypothetical protein
MTTRASLGLSFTMLFAATGCVHSPRMSAVHIDQPGTDIVSGEGSISIAHTTGNTSRVCTRLVPQGKKGKSGGRGGAQPAPGAYIDVLLFRLCEARGNGDIGAEQYASSVQTIMKMMEASSMRPRMPMMRQSGQDRGPRDFGDGGGPRGEGEGRGMRRGPWGGPGPDRPDGPPPGKPEPAKKDAPK